MQFIAVDARTDAYNQELLGVAWVSPDDIGWSDDWPLIREALVEAAYNGHTLIAHNAESQIASLFYRTGESFEAQYLNDAYIGGSWTYERNVKPMQVWDSFALSGGLSILELAKLEGIELHPAPRRIHIRPLSDDERVCWDHRRRNCPKCMPEVSRYGWVCLDHQRGECLECWQTQTVLAVRSYADRYATYLGGYGIRPKRTVGSAAVALWKVLDSPDKCWLRDTDSDRLARQGYYGGRVDAFKLGHINEVFYADVNNMYASVMATAPMPDPNTTEYNDSPSLDARWIEYEGVSECDVTIPTSYCPPLPVRHGEQLVYPVGKVRGTFTHVELRNAIQRGVAIGHVYKTVYATTVLNPFETFSNGLLRYRAELKAQRSPLEQLIKLLLNSLPGRHGLRQDQENVYVTPLPPGTTDRDWPHHEILVKDDHILMRRSKHGRIRDPYANPLWAATINGYARVKIHEYMEMQGHSLAYCDTDSIISTSPINGLGEGPGQLEDKGYYAEAWILAPKVYHLTGGKDNDRTHVAGVPRAVALRYMQSQTAQWNRPIGILDAWSHDGVPGELRIINADRRLNLSKRHLIDPTAVGSDAGWTDTQPLTFAMGAPIEDEYEQFQPHEGPFYR